MSSPPGWSSLNEEQRAAALHDIGPAAVFAGPGSGKTRVVTMRAARLAEMGARVLVTTFTNDATLEMRGRLAPMVPKDATKRLTISTLHAFCLSLLKMEGEKRTVLTDTSQIRGLAEAAQSSDLEGGTSPFLNRVSFLKSSGESAKSYVAENNAEDRAFKSTWLAFEKSKLERGLLEFDDLILETLALLKSSSDVLTRHASRFTHLLVDEAQDMNKPQFAIILALGKVHHNVMMVGDPDQSLYSFRGADIDTFRFFARHSSTRRFLLRNNYRSVPPIVAMATGLLKGDETREEIVSIPTRKGGEQVTWKVFADADTEAVATGEELIKLHNQGMKWSNAAVLFRVNAQAEAIQRHFAALEIPFIANQSGDFYSRKEIAGILSYLEFSQSLADEWLLSFLNLPNRKLKKTVGAELGRVAALRGRSIWHLLPEYIAPDYKTSATLNRMREDLIVAMDDISKADNAGKAVRAIRHTMGFDNWLRQDEINAKDNDRIQNLDQMEEAASHYKTVQSYLDAIRKVREESERRKQEMKRKRTEIDAVTLATGHGAKGLEWRRVYAIGWSEGLLPHRKSEDEAEERRVAYVIATRAMDHLTISSLQNWNLSTVSPSRFLTGLNLILGVDPVEPNIIEPNLKGADEEHYLGEIFT
ncbi:MAG: ATP-dependent helicase [Chthonomonadales bacterium]